jgi:ATP-binding cassette subfamily B protein
MRALINEPEILLIDEGTSGMDRDTEALIIKLLAKIKGKIGILLVTHRINLIKRLCDRIYILENRTIRESGTHEELIAGDNIYRRFWDDFK